MYTFSDKKLPFSPDLLLDKSIEGNRFFSALFALYMGADPNLPHRNRNEMDCEFYRASCLRTETILAALFQFGVSPSASFARNWQSMFHFYFQRKYPYLHSSEYPLSRLTEFKEKPANLVELKLSSVDPRFYAGKLWSSSPPPLPIEVKDAYLASLSSKPGFFPGLFDSTLRLSLEQPFKFKGSTGPIFCLTSTIPEPDTMIFAQHRPDKEICKTLYMILNPSSGYIDALKMSEWLQIKQTPRISHRPFEFIPPESFSLQQNISSCEFTRAAEILARKRTASFSFIERHVAMPIGQSRLLPPEEAVVAGDILSLDFYLEHRIPVRACNTLIPLAILFNQHQVLEYLLLRRKFDPGLCLAIHVPFNLILDPSSVNPQLRSCLGRLQGLNAYDLNQEVAHCVEPAIYKHRCQLLMEATSITDEQIPIMAASTRVEPYPMLDSYSRSQCLNELPAVPGSHAASAAPGVGPMMVKN